METLQQALAAAQSEAQFWRRQAEASAAKARDEAELVNLAVREARSASSLTPQAQAWVQRSSMGLNRQQDQICSRPPLNPPQLYTPQARISSQDGIAAKRCSLEGASASAPASPALAALRFSCRADGLPLLGRSGARLVLCGSLEPLGGWSVDRALPLRRDASGQWCSDLLLLPTGCLVAYKYVLITAAGNVLWQSGADNILAVRRSEAALEVNDDWSAEESLCSVVSWRRADAAAGGEAEGAEEEEDGAEGRAQRRKERLQALIYEV